MRRTLLGAMVVLLAGCATRAPAEEPDARRAGTQIQAQRYQTTRTVMQTRTHGPELCVGPTLAVHPPRCGGLPVTNWSWDRVEGERRAGDRTWGTYHLVGTYDGAAFTVIAASPPPPARQPSAEERFRNEPKPACPEPPGGWAVPDPGRASERFLAQVIRAAEREPDVAGVWLSYLAPMGHNVAEDPGEFVLNLTFTGDIARHQRELRPRWGGRLCVAQQPRSRAELQRIQRELDGGVAMRLGLRVFSSGVRDNANAVSLEALVIDDRTQAALDARYGRGAVGVTAELTPVA
jgi:hypothetical protein